MKIAFLIIGFNSPSSRYRVLQYLPILNKRGYISTAYQIPTNFLERINLFKKLKNFDIVFLQKKLLTSFWLYLLRKYSRTLIYDFDDAIMFRDSNKNNHFSISRMKKFLKTVKNADIVIAGNKYLESFAIKENPRTIVIPTSIDMNRYIEKPASASSENLTLGWVGSSSTLLYLERMKCVWDKIYESYPFVRLKIVADRFFDSEKMPIIKKKWNYEDEIKDLHTFDIGLMPLTDDPWSRGKCGFKLLQCMAVGVPVICSPVGVNEEIVIDGENGFCANDESEWLEKIRYLIENDELRCRMGIKARETVIKRYSLKVNVEKLIDILNGLKV